MGHTLYDMSHVEKPLTDEYLHLVSFLFSRIYCNIESNVNFKFGWENNLFSCFFSGLMFPACVAEHRRVSSDLPEKKRMVLILVLSTASAWFVLIIILVYF